MPDSVWPLIDRQRMPIRFAPLAFLGMADLGVRRVAVLGLLASLSLSCAAQTLPGAGGLQQQIDKERRPSSPENVAPVLSPEPPRVKPGGVSVAVSRFLFVGNSLLGEAVLARAVAPFLNQSLDFAGLERAAAAVAEAYRTAGWVVRTYIPAQEMIGGVVTIQVVEAVFGRIVREGVEPTRIRPGYLIDLIEAQQKPGEPLNAQALERALLMANDVPGIAAHGVLRQGARERETDLVLRTADEPIAIGEAAIDNGGSRFTGRERLMANLNLNSPLGHGDLLTAHIVHSRGSDYVRVAATAPLGLDGLRAGAYASRLQYRLIASEFAPLNANGTSDVLGVEVTYPVIRARSRNLYLSANIDHKVFENWASESITSRYSSDTLVIGLVGNSFDRVAGGGANSASLSFVQGRLNLDGSPNQAADAASARTAGNFSKVRYSLGRQQGIAPEVTAFASFSGQLASKNMDASEKFYLGGPNGVRAYPTGEAGGSVGQLVTLELRRRFADSYSLAGFIDHGRVMVNRDTSFAGSVPQNRYSLTGGGVALGWQSGNANLRLSWARRLGSNPNATPAGRDQDGSLVKNRIWLLAALRF